MRSPPTLNEPGIVAARLIEIEIENKLCMLNLDTNFWRLRILITVAKSSPKAVMWPVTIFGVLELLNVVHMVINRQSWLPWSVSRKLSALGT